MLARPQTLASVDNPLGIHFAQPILLVLRYKEARCPRACRWELWHDLEFTDG